MKDPLPDPSHGDQEIPTRTEDNLFMNREVVKLR